MGARNVTGDNQTLNIGVLGFGYWGPNQVRNFAALRSRGVEVRAVADLDPVRRIQAADMFPEIATVERAESVIDDPEIDAVVIATPAHTHYQLGQAALLAGKHILVEKPVTTKLADAQRLTSLASELGLTLMVGHTYEYAPAVDYLHDLLNSGDIGDTLYMRSQRVNLGQHQKHINVLWDLAPHDISVFTYLLGAMPTHVSAIGRAHVTPGIPDIVSLTLPDDNTVMANVILSWLDPRKVRDLTIIGTRKMVVYDDTATAEKISIYDKGANGPDQYRSYGEFQVTYRYGDRVSPVIQNHEPLREQSEHFVSCIRNGKTPKSDGASGERVVRVLAAAQRSLDNEGMRTALDEPGLEDVDGTINHADRATS